MLSEYRFGFRLANLVSADGRAYLVRALTGTRWAVFSVGAADLATLGLCEAFPTLESLKLLSIQQTKGAAEEFIHETTEAEQNPNARFERIGFAS